MAVDANVLVFERIREEQNSGKKPFQALEHGYAQAFSTIMDANITTFIAARCALYARLRPCAGLCGDPGDWHPDIHVYSNYADTLPAHQAG